MQIDHSQSWMDIPQEVRVLLHEGAFGQKKAAMELELMDAGTDYATLEGIVRSNYKLYQGNPEKLSEQMNADLGELVENEYLRTRAQLFCNVELATQNLYYMLQASKVMDNAWGRRIFAPELQKTQRDIAKVRGTLIDHVSLLAEESRPMTALRIDSMLDEMRLSLGMTAEGQAR